MFKNLVHFSTLVFFVCINITLSSSIERDLLKSFVPSYDFSTSGRYSHEYHPFLLRKTAKSLARMESSLRGKGFDIKGRVVIMGYEGNAISSYFPSFRDSEGGIIDDEYVAKELKGWSLQLHNRFGLMSGFLFRDIEKTGTKYFRHINPHRVEIFHPQMNVFQKDAFGPLAQMLFDSQNRIMEHARKDNWKAIFAELIPFWNSLYGSEGKTGDTQVAGTQDILFTVENTRFLHDSTVPLIKFYTGGDVTYPIVLSKHCGYRATFNAQCFVKEFSQMLKQVDGESTVYIFKSFVDGVGKSTLLGNIKNYQRFGADIDRYESVDNTSSLVADMFEYAPGVHIADLPAQMSHFTYKPDGLVYVDLSAVGASHGNEQDIRQYFEKNKKKLITEYQVLVDEIKKEPSVVTDSDIPKRIFVRNVVVLNRSVRNRSVRNRSVCNPWIPVSYNDREYLVDRRNARCIRVLLPLPDARSEGLKNIEPEQMLFTNGVSFPPPYKMFLDDLIEKCRVRGVKKVVFVDFLSMYSRSSRENIRINYLLQQLGQLYPNFDPYMTLYRNFSSNSELLALLQTKKGFESVTKTFSREAEMRVVFYQMMKDSAGDLIRTMSSDKVLKKLKAYRLTGDDQKFLHDLVAKKIVGETNHLEKTYGDTKEFLNIQTIKPELLFKFSEFLQELFTRRIKNTRLNALWSNLGYDVVCDGMVSSEGPCDKIVHVKNAGPMRARFILPPECKNPTLLDGFCRLVRTSWYKTLINLVSAKGFAHGAFELKEEEEFVLPLLVKRGTDGAMYVVQKLMEPDPKLTQQSAFSMVDKRIGLFMNAQYPIDLCEAQTNRGVFAFGSDSPKGRGSFPHFESTMYSVVWEHQYHQGGEKVLFAVDAYEAFCRRMNSYFGEMIKSRMFQLAEKNSKFSETKKDSKDSESVQSNQNLMPQFGNQQQKKKKQKNIMFCCDDQKEPIKLFIRSIVTLESILRDVRSDIVVRRGNKRDFRAGLKLWEQAVIPQCFRILCKDSLFARLKDFDPVITKY
ncbi:hypothetical protein KAU11_02785 [Candidatus Babeliales bacterium]|nr:hypothetical protein [Candidatus Babeliales bacterium]